MSQSTIGKRTSGEAINLECTEDTLPPQQEVELKQYVTMALNTGTLLQIASVYRKIDGRILPFVGLIYLFCFLDRSNIGNAKILNESTSDDLMTSLNMSEHQYRIALMLFLVAYCIFEAPSNLALKVFSPGRWLAFLIASFGAVCAGIGGAKNVQTLMALRAILGMAEAGVFPGMVFYLSFWYSPRERASRIAIFLASATLAGAFGGAIAYGVGYMNKTGGLNAWRWLFILEGLPCLILALAVLLFLPNYPETASWLTVEEKHVLQLSFGANMSRRGDKLNWKDAKATLKNVLLWLHYIIYFCVGIGVSSLSLFAPTIVQGIGYTGLSAQLFTIPPYACAYVLTMVAAHVSDKYTCRGPVISVCCLVGVISFIIPACIPGPALHLRYAMLVLSTCAAFASVAPLCAWVSDNVHNTTAGSLASGLNIAFTGPGQIVGIWIYQSQQSPRYQLGHAINAASQLVAMTLSCTLWWVYRRRNLRLAPEEQRWIA